MSMRMSEEQFEALVVAVTATAKRCANDGLGEFSERHGWDALRRLIVEPEQAKPIHDGPCCGGPLDGSSMAMDEKFVTRPGGEYQWNGFVGAWYWAPEADPDLTTFGELGGRGWFELVRDVWDEDDRIRLLAEGGDVYDESGMKRMVGKDEPVRRLPQPEFKS